MGGTTSPIGGSLLLSVFAKGTTTDYKGVRFAACTLYLPKQIKYLLFSDIQYPKRLRLEV